MKYLKLLSLTLILTFWSVASMSQYRHYYFSAPDIEDLLPFSKTELQIFKDKGIKTIEIRKEMMDERFISYLDEQGRVYSEEWFYTHKKKEIPYGKTSFKYNDKGLLTLRYSNSYYVLAYDSITYDDNGRILSYYSYRRYPKKRNKFGDPEIEFNLNVYYSDENKVILFDSTMSGLRFYTFDNNNQVIYTNIFSDIDSISIDTISDTEYFKRYWFKNEGDTLFKLGKEYYFKNGLLETETEWKEAWGKSTINYITYYTYDQNNRLMRTENENRYQIKKFYTYYFKSGLLMEEITINGKSLFINTYVYKTQNSKFVH